MLNSQETRTIETSYDRLKIKRNHISNIGKFVKAGVFRCYKYPQHKRYYYTFDNSLLFTESIQNTTQTFKAIKS